MIDRWREFAGCLLIAGGLLMIGGCSDDEELTESNATDSQPTQSTATSGDADIAATAPLELPLDAALIADGWIALFDGHSLFGWQANSDANWRVEDGAITVDEGERGLLLTTSPFADYELVLDFRSAEGTNSGIFLDTPERPQDPATDCYELNIAPADNPFPTGSLVGREKVEGDHDQPDTWRTYRVQLENGQVTVHLDDVLILEYRDPDPLQSGRVGLQLNEGAVAFRNIRLRPLGLSPLFNGGDLSGWREPPDNGSRFTVTEDGALNVRDGRGYLESEREFGDFILQLDCISHARQLNSGIFFRCIPGETMNGYESQIHNGYESGDRTQPVDFGTGGIFRRQPARRVMANDGEWFTKTIIASGDHFAVWVNGYQVSDWTDSRGPDANPREGLRTAAGTLQIQGHDPTTNLSFRHLRAAELP